MEGALAPVADHRLGIWGSIGSGVCGFTHRLSGAWPIALCGFTPEQRTLDFAGYMADLIGRFGLEKHLEFNRLGVDLVSVVCAAGATGAALGRCDRRYRDYTV